jgi:glutaminase
MGRSGRAALPLHVFLAVQCFVLLGCAQRQAAAQDGASIEQAVKAAYEKEKDNKSGKNADYIPELAKVPSDLFAVTVVTVDGKVYSLGDDNHPFSIQSCSKVFTMCHVLQESGGDAELLEKIGVEPTGLPFNSTLAMGLYKEKPQNPLVNAGAIGTVGLVKASSSSERWSKILATYNAFADGKLTFIDEVYKSEAATNFRNRAFACTLYNNGRLKEEPIEVTDVYTKACSVGVTAKQLAIMGATLANRGVNPITGKSVLDAKYVPKVLAVMMTAGFYDESGMWSYRAGVPAKTGVGGGIVAVVPGKMAIVGFCPRLNEAGNSIRATRAIEDIIGALDLNLFGSGKPK